MAAERRHFGRIPFGIEAVLNTPRETYLGKLIDISLKGALIEFPSPPEDFAEGSQGWLKILLENELALEFTAKNVHVDGNQVGVRFTEFSLDTLSHLRRLIELNSGDAEQVREELHFLIE